MNGELCRDGAGEASDWGGTAIMGGDGAAFGGQMAAQAMMSACRHVDGRLPVSIRSIFLSAARPQEAIRHNVSLLRAGRAFTFARVETRQGDRHCLSSDISFHVEEASPEHQQSMPCVPSPHDCPVSTFIPAGTDPVVRECFDIREVESDPQTTNGHHPRQSYWLRYRENLGEDQAVHRAALVWFSDLSMPWTTDLAYDERHGRRVGASLDHNVWFHRMLRADEWLLFVQESLVYSGARALTRGIFYTQDGMLVASAAQETLLRRVKDDRP